MKELTNIAMLLGEENEKRLKDGITDLLLQQVEEDIKDKYRYDYIIAFDDIFEEIRKQIEEEFEDKLAKKYRKLMNNKLKEISIDKN